MARALRPFVLVLLVTGACFTEPPRPGGGGDAGNGSGGMPNRVFVTSTTQPLGSLGSLDAADTICNQRAVAGGLEGTYVAWLSSSTMSAKLRLGNARGWVRVDGLPFADKIEDLVAGRIWYPPRLDELGGDHSMMYGDQVATSTHPDGSSDVASTCSDFTSQSLTTDSITGVPTGGAGGWTAHDSAHCGTPTHLYCFGIDHQAVVAAPQGTGRYAFLTSQNVANSGGRDKVDLECANEAASQGLQGTYVALLATTTQAAADRFTTAGLPWYRLDGVRVTDDLVNLLAPIDVTAGGQYVSYASTAQAIFPWTGALDSKSTSAISTTANCTDWMQVSGNGIVGDASVAASPTWFDDRLSAACTVARTAYCLQQ